MSSLRWRKGRNSSLCNHWAGEKEETFEIRVYLVIKLEEIRVYVVTGEKGEISEIRIYLIVKL